MLDNNITPDAVVSVEAQYATERAFIGTKNKNIPLFADLVSRPSILNILQGKKYFYLSEYTKSPLLERIKSTFPQLPVIEPLGSVGLTCTELACMLRKDDALPIFVCGLDFSFKPGKSHCNESPHIKYALQYSNKFSPFGNVGSAYGYGAHNVLGKNNENVITDKALKGYGDLFSMRYKNVPNIFDISHFGLNNSLQKPTLEEVQAMLLSFDKKSVVIPETSTFKIETINNFYENEKNLLNSIKSMLIGEKSVCKKTLLELIDSCNYLYAHFPDGHEAANLRQDFLNRIRFEVEEFLFIINSKNY